MFIARACMGHVHHPRVHVHVCVSTYTRVLKRLRLHRHSLICAGRIPRAGSFFF
ncbi:unnamed protein product [Chondrus crispus]|uniref:Uncharacterized protein n=1 Tax=Chondrus crispus TaxID=2769 RepID=R7QJE5_CHOCR|nr:unnamed protein product [Chondrus crispus]CDF37878.1 unnamed protein product [Chondrus crispus]|eukprot:XP_005717749.1 unnamed protein product [Chondrus crispus]